MEFAAHRFFISVPPCSPRMARKSIRKNDQDCNLRTKGNRLFLPSPLYAPSNKGQQQDQYIRCRDSPEYCVPQPSEQDR